MVFTTLVQRVRKREEEVREVVKDWTGLAVVLGSGTNLYVRGNNRIT